MPAVRTGNLVYTSGQVARELTGKVGAEVSAEDANTAMLDAGILTPDQVADVTKPVGTGIALTGITVEQLEAAGLKRHGASTI